MPKAKAFKSYIDRIVKIFVLCNEPYLVVRELYRTEESSKYINNLKFEGPFFTLTKVNYYRVLVLQLSKLFIESDKEYFNIVKLLNNCKEGGDFGSLKLDHIFVETQLKTISEKKGLIDKIRIQRNKIFAHDDPKNIIIVNDITLDQIKDLIELCDNIIFQVYKEVYNKHFSSKMSPSPLGNLRKILKSLDEREISRTQENINRINLFKKG